MEGVGLGTAGEDAWSAFNAYFTEQQRAIGMLAYRLCGAADVAEEVAADAFAEAWRRWDELTRDEPRPSLEAMRAIVERLVQRRVHRAGRTAVPQDGGEPDVARVRALLFERITLIPPQDAPTVVIPRIVEPIAATAPEEPARRFPRPLLIGGLIATGAVVVIGAIATAASNTSAPTDSNRSPLSLAASGTIGAVASAAPGSAATSGSPSPSASPSPSHSPSASPTPSRTTPSASPSASTASAQSPSASASATTSEALTASADVNSGSNSSWTQLNVNTSVEQNLSALTITINVAYCNELSPAGAWDSGAGGQFAETTTVNGDGSLTYVFALASGDEATPGGISFAAQFSHSRHGWSASADTYSVTAQLASTGATETLSGSF